ncbi:ComEC/Rec2 family competence protein [Psychroserpens luteus]|uniref:ComEC/Rec2 family competence protein n=1 Tax=Psychroserpens luteus TaxID=1434066 RepID=A0ABW5ZY61_9FLAO|nr:MBL fold metallo-hydrolase [Psychroserpens luteus]
MISVKFLQGYNGDCVLISLKDSTNSIKNILIDGGTGSTYSKRRKAGDLKKAVLSLADKNQTIDLLVITHIDDDHIGGILKMFEDKKFDRSIIKKVWFNSGKLIAENFDSEGEFKDRDIELSIYKDSNTSVRQGVRLDEFLNKLGCWDYRIIKKGIIEKIDNCKITVLSPDDNGLKKLHAKWERERPESLDTSAGKTDYHLSIKELIENEDVFEEDGSVPNGSSIAFLLEFEDKKLLLLGDAYPNVIKESLINLGYSIDKKIELDLLKISHHASKKNTNLELLELIDCDTYVTLTNSLKHGLPDKRTFARIIKNNPESTLLFNYDIVNKVFSEEDLNSGKFEANYLNRESITLD